MISSMPATFQDQMIPIFIDNSNNLAWLIKETAPIGYLPVLKPLLSLMMKHNIRLYPILIPSKVNELADLASRGDTQKLDAMIPPWKSLAPQRITVRLPNHSKPGPLFLWKKGYIDQRPLPPSLIWQDYSVDTLLY